MPDICRMILGADGHGAYGAFATLPGHDARTADPADTLKWAFRSDWPRVENLHQVGRVTGLNGAASFAKRVDFPALAYVPFVSVRYESAPGIMQDDPWCKGTNQGGEWKPYFSPYRILAGVSWFAITAPTGQRHAIQSPAPPASAVYFVWKIAAGALS